MMALQVVRTIDLPDGWIGAGFVRDAMWDHLHGWTGRKPSGDVDVVWFDPDRIDAADDAAVEGRLHTLCEDVDWSVRNQARMHHRNGDRPYRSVADAMTFWPETATAVAVRLTQDDRLEINAPLGLDDLVGLRLMPKAGREATFAARVAAKHWLTRYPKLRVTAS
ncbi:hypothetical protein GL174_09595 [Sphingobium sp. CAP-1]|nr:hypothetical protein GL174_09595 [Sphingobium sp. CAP-1]